MKIIEKDILTVDKGIICQSVNCQGVMGSGLAKQIREKWPIVWDKYNYECQYDKNHIFRRLGNYHFAEINKSLIVCNIFGQLNYGYDGKRYTDYGALNWAFSNLSEFYSNEQKIPSDWNIYFPYNFGCDRGGADWNIVSKMIDFYFPNAIICKLP